MNTAIAASIGLVVSGAIGLGARRIPFLMRPNYRDAPVSLATGVGVSAGSIVGLTLLGRDRFAIALLAVAIAGALDDASRSSARGLRGHARSLKRGRPTTGILKIVVIVAAGLYLFGWRSPQAVILAAAMANVLNGLDRGPGRAGKWFLLVGLPLIAPVAAVSVVVAAEVPALALDLTERGMLGDVGANVLGFALGTALVAAMHSVPELRNVFPFGAALLAVALNIVAETVTFSRVIRAVGPLRWFDGLGTSAEWRTFSANRRS